MEYGLAAGSRWLTGTHDLYVSGGVGAGKTCLACALGHAAVEAGESVAFLVVDAFVSAARDLEVQDDHDRGVAVVDRARTCDVLILDDVGATEKPSDYTLRVLLALYNHRTGKRLRTIWTSNKTLQQLSDWLKDDRLTSRIAGHAELVHLEATDYRPEKGRQERAWAH